MMPFIMSAMLSPAPVPALGSLFGFGRQVQPDRGHDRESGAGQAGAVERDDFSMKPAGGVMAREFPVKSRIAIHFPGYEPLNGAQHRERYARSLAQSAATFGFSAQAGELVAGGFAPWFTVTAESDGWRTQTRMHLLDHADIIARQKDRPLAKRIVAGFGAFTETVSQGGLWAYFRNAWRFALFFLFPFLYVAAAMAAALGLASSPLWAGFSPLWLCVSIPVAAFAFLRGFIPFSERLHTLHLFADWELAIALARLADPGVNARIKEMSEALSGVFREDADEHLITSHSMGGAFVLHALGGLLERDPLALAGRRITLVTLGGPGHQVSLLSKATALRRRIGLVLAHPHIEWIDMQCLTDICTFYGARIAHDTGHAGLKEPLVQRIRMKTMITPERYARIKRDFLRVHRQFVLGSDRVSRFDFQVMTAGPNRAGIFAMTTEDKPAPL
jgi:hypothetical protein